jgi:hypothetical protein
MSRRALPAKSESSTLSTGRCGEVLHHHRQPRTAALRAGATLPPAKHGPRLVPAFFGGYGEASCIVSMLPFCSHVNSRAMG